jgi:uncharacterized protein with HEPN domain
MRKISLFIKDILENIKKTEDFVAGMSFEAFKNDEKTNYALIRCIEIIGEASKRVPDEIKQAYPEIPWRDMAGMRDKLIHFYFGLNVEKISACGCGGFTKNKTQTGKGSVRFGKPKYIEPDRQKGTGGFNSRYKIQDIFRAGGNRREDGHRENH